MSFGGLPPPRRNNNNDLGELLGGVASLALLVAFFASPLGGIVFAVFNSLLAFAFLAPVVLVVLFQAWQYFNTVEGNCPNCGAPLRIVKDPNQSSICMNCGAFVVADGKDGIGLVGGGGGGQEIVDDSIFGSLFDNVFEDSWGTKRSTSSGNKPSFKSDKVDIIDVEIEDKK